MSSSMSSAVPALRAGVTALGLEVSCSAAAALTPVQGGLLASAASGGGTLRAAAPTAAVACVRLLHAAAHARRRGAAHTVRLVQRGTTVGSRRVGDTSTSATRGFGSGAAGARGRGGEGGVQASQALQCWTRLQSYHAAAARAPAAGGGGTVGAAGSAAQAFRTHVSARGNDLNPFGPMRILFWQAWASLPPGMAHQLPAGIFLMLAPHTSASALAPPPAASSAASRAAVKPPARGPSVLSRFLALITSALAAIALMWRVVVLTAIFAPAVFTAPLALGDKPLLSRATWMARLRRALEAGGPAFIKWGQWAATRHDLFPPDLCDELEHLHSEAPPHVPRFSVEAVERTFGMPLSTLFDSFEGDPLASGSIGQVHRATLSELGARGTGFKAGETVAVKVRHPGVDEAIARDFALMTAAAHLLGELPSLQHLRLEQTLKQFAAPLREQVDLSREAQHLQRFNYNFRKNPQVHFPRPIYPWVNEEVLVESYEEGVSINSIIKRPNPQQQLQRKELAHLGSGTMLQMMLFDNLIHSDLHPGNILVRLDPPDGLILRTAWYAAGLLSDCGLALPARLASLPSTALQAWQRPRIVLLDCGMATELTETDRHNMMRLFRGFSTMDGAEVAKWTLAFSGEEQSCPDPEGFMQDIEQEFARLRSVSSWEEYGATHGGSEALNTMLEMARTHGVSLPGHIASVVVTTLVLEGWSSKLDPEHSTLERVKGFVGRGGEWHERISRTVDRVCGHPHAAIDV